MKKILQCLKPVCCMMLITILVMTCVSTALGEQSFTVRGKTLKASDFDYLGKNQCWAYAQKVYEYIWGKGVNFSSDFIGTESNGYNLLRDLLDEERKITAANTKKFITATELGATVRIQACPSWCPNFNSDGFCSTHTPSSSPKEHSLILVQKDANGCTMMDQGSSSRTTYYTWSEFASRWTNYKYFKYIKWPKAGALPSTLKRGSAMTSGAGQTIPDGNYKIVNASNNNFFLDISGSATTAPNNQNVAMWSGEPKPECDLWTVSYNGNGYYLIKQMNTNKCLEVKNGDTRVTANVQVYSSNGNAKQEWSIKPYGAGYVVQSRVSGYTLEVEGSLKDKANVRQNEQKGTSGQIWQFIPYSPVQTVTYNANGGEYAPPAQEFNRGSSVVLTYDIPYKSNCSFIGWSTDMNATQAQYFPGTEYTFSDSCTLYAVWAVESSGELRDMWTVYSTVSGGEKQLFSFVPEITCMYEIRSIDSGDTVGKLLDSNMNILYENDDYYGIEFSIFACLEAGQLYYLQAGFYSSSASGQISISVQKVPKQLTTLQQATQTFMGDISVPGENAYYEIVPLITADYAISSYGEYDTVGYLYDSGWTQLDYGDDSAADSNFVIHHRLEAGKHYYLRVKYYSTFMCGTLPFQVSLVKENLREFSNSGREISTGGQRVFYTFTPTFDTYYTYRSNNTSGDPYGYIYDSNWNLIAEDDDSGGNMNFEITCSLRTNETYYLAAGFWDSSYTGTIHVEAYPQYTVIDNINKKYYAEDDPDCPVRLYAFTPQVPGNYWIDTSTPEGGKVYSTYSMLYKESIFPLSTHSQGFITRAEAGTTYFMMCNTPYNGGEGGNWFEVRANDEYIHENVTLNGLAGQIYSFYPDHDTAYRLSLTTNTPYCWIYYSGSRIGGQCVYVDGSSCEMYIDMNSANVFNVGVVPPDGTNDFAFDLTISMDSTTISAGYVYEVPNRNYQAYKFYDFTPNETGNFALSMDNYVARQDSDTITLTVYDENWHEVAGKKLTGAQSICLSVLLEHDKVYHLGVYSKYIDAYNTYLYVDREYVGLYAQSAVDAEITMKEMNLHYILWSSSGGQFRLFTLGDKDTMGCLYDAGMNQLVSDDDSGQNQNFEISYYLEPETPYYLDVRMFGDATGHMCVIAETGHMVTGGEVLPATETTDGYLNQGFCSLCGEIITESAAISHNAILKIPAKVSVIGDEAFAGGAFEQVNIPNGVECIGSKAFADCQNLRIVVIPDSVYEIISDAFDAGRDIVFVCHANTWAERFANEHGYRTLIYAE